MAKTAEQLHIVATPHADGRRRCAWCTTDPLYMAYHDNEWGVPVRADQRLFEMLCLEGAQAGLSWLTILRKRENYRAAFDQFDAAKIARYGARKRNSLLRNAGIVRNRLKVDAFIGNAQAYLEICEQRGGFADYIWQFTNGRVVRRRPRYLSDIAQSTPYSDAMSKDLKQKRFRFVGSTICHAFMQAVGIVDEHQRQCWRAAARTAGQGAAAALLALTWLLAGTANADAAAVKPAFLANDVFDLQWVADPQISPDGRGIAYVRMRMDIKTDKPMGDIWLVDADGKHARPLSNADNSSQPRWSPDGSRIAYVGSGADGSKQLFVFWTQSGVTATISHFLESPSNLAWSPDGGWLAFTMPAPAEHKSLKVEVPEAPKGAKWADPPKLIDRMVFRVDGEGYLPNSFNHLFVVAADGGAARQLTHGDYDTDGAPAFTADGKGILFASNRRDDADFEPIDSEIYRVDLADDSLHALTDRRGPDHSPAPSPDGKHIAYLGFDDRRLGYQATQLYVMDSDGTHSHSLTALLDRDAAAPHWSKDGRQLVFQYDDRGAGKLASVDLQGNLKVLAADVGGGDITRPYTGGNFSVSGAGRFAYTRATPNAPPALATGTSLRDIATLAALSEPLLSARSLGSVEEVAFTSSVDARKLQGWIIKPPGFDTAKKYPLVLEIHGGPYASYGPSFAAELQLYAAAGYVVLYMNPRGSTSYGEEFADMIHHDYPDKDFDDLMSGVDAVARRGFVDNDRLFVTGGSGGGVLTAWIVGHTDRFRAAVVVKPVINWASFVLTADMTSYFYRYWFAGFPWDDVEGYWKRSPLAYAGNVHTPTMLMTGEVDYRTPSTEAEQFYEALKLRKIDTALVRVPNASHDISARPSLLIDKVAYVLAWFHAHDKAPP
jgi:DNA-3-methyladenine glycosylase I